MGVPKKRHLHIQGKHVGVATLPVDLVDVRPGHLQLGGLLLRRVQDEAGQVVFVGLSVLRRLLGFCAEQHRGSGGSVRHGVMVVAGIASLIHAFAIREDYLVRLERQIDETSEVDRETSLYPGAEGGWRPASPGLIRGSKRETPNGSPSPKTTELNFEGPVTKAVPETQPESSARKPPERTPEAPSVAPAESSSEVSPEAPDEAPPEAPRAQRPRVRNTVDAGQTARPEPPPTPERIADTYPLPLAYSWSLCLQLVAVAGPLGSEGPLQGTAAARREHARVPRLRLAGDARRRGLREGADRRQVAVAGRHLYGRLEASRAEEREGVLDLS